VEKRAGSRPELELRGLQIKLDEAVFIVCFQCLLIDGFLSVRLVEITKVFDEVDLQPIVGSLAFTVKGLRVPTTRMVGNSCWIACSTEQKSAVLPTDDARYSG
jgi:hypothetical protein